MTDHTREEALQWALNHAEAAEACGRAYPHDDGTAASLKASRELHREARLATMWAQIAQAMP